MTIIFRDEFTSRDLSGYNYVAGTPIFITSPVDPQKVALSFPAALGILCYVQKVLPVSSPKLYVGLSVIFSPLMPLGTTISLGIIFNAAWTDYLSVSVLRSTDGASARWQLTTPTNSYSVLTDPLQENRKYFVEFKRGVGEVSELWLDGVKLFDVPETPTEPSIDVRFGTMSPLAYTAIFEDVTIADAPIGLLDRGFLEAHTFDRGVEVASTITVSGVQYAVPASNPIPLAPGNYVVYWPTYNLSEPVQIVAGQTALLNLYYTPAAYSLTVTSTPSGIPFTLGSVHGEMSYVTPIVLTLASGTYLLAVPSNVQLGENIYNFSGWEDTSTNPYRLIALDRDRTVAFFYQLVIPPPPPLGTLDIHAFYQGQEVVAPGRIVETGEPFITPVAIQVTPGPYTLEVTVATITQQVTVTALEGQTIRVDIMVEAPPKIPLGKWLIPVGSIAVGAVLAVATR